MTEWKDDAELFALMQSTLYTPVVGDILDQLEMHHQFLPQAVQPLVPDMVLAGRAMPALQIDVHGLQDEPFGRMTHALDNLKPGEIYVGNGGSLRCANWGEIMTAAARARGAVGAVVNGYHRDTPRVLEQRWPVFSRGCYAQDSGPRMKVVDYRCRIEIEGVWIAPGDVIFGDIDGVVVIPQDCAVEVITRALEKARAEKTVRHEIENGMSSTDAFARYGVL